MAVGCAGVQGLWNNHFSDYSARCGRFTAVLRAVLSTMIEFRWSANSAVLPFSMLWTGLSYLPVYRVQALSGLLGRTGISLFGRDFMSSRRSWAARAVPQANSTQRNQGWAGFLIRLTAASATMTTRKTARWMTKPRSGGSLNLSCCGVERVRFAIRRPLAS